VADVVFLGQGAAIGASMAGSIGTK
jgi:hypothetical protein